jgi:hypothetical protein
MSDQIKSRETLQAILERHLKGEIGKAGVAISTKAQPDRTIRVTVTASDSAGQATAAAIGNDLQSSGQFACSSVAGGVSCVSLR